MPGEQHRTAAHRANRYAVRRRAHRQHAGGLARRREQLLAARERDVSGVGDLAALDRARDQIGRTADRHQIGALVVADRLHRVRIGLHERGLAVRTRERLDAERAGACVEIEHA